MIIINENIAATWNPSTNGSKILSSPAGCVMARVVAIGSWQSWTAAMETRSNPALGIAFFLASQSCIVVDGILVHYLGNDATVLQLTLVRGVGTAMLALILARHQGASVFRTKHLFLQIFRAALTFVSIQLIFYSMANLPLSDAVAINYSRALFIMIFGALLLGEAATMLRWAATAAGFCGAMMIIDPVFFEWRSAYVAAVLGAIANAGALAATRFLGRHDSATTILAYLAVVPLALSLPASTQSWPWHSWPALVAVGASGALGLWFGLLAVRETDVSLLAPFDYVRLPLTMALGFLLFREVPSGSTVTGSAVILLSGGFLLLREKYNLGQRFFAVKR